VVPDVALVALTIVVFAVLVLVLRGLERLWAPRTSSAWCWRSCSPATWWWRCSSRRSS